MRPCVKCQLVLLTVATLALTSETLADVLEEARKGIERYRKDEVTIDVHRS
jgi:hypothetical protein